MSSRMFRWVGVAIPVFALTFGSWAVAQEQPKKPEPKPEVTKPEVKPQEPKKEEPKNDKDIIAVATENKLNTFVDLVKMAGLTDDLKKPGPFTVFAPTDEAFKACKELDDLKKPENKAKLADFLKGHVVAKKVDVKKDKDAKPMHGADIKLAEKDGKVTVNETIKVTKDLTASNGVIHVIDHVIAAAEKKPEIKPLEKMGEKKEEPKKPAEKPGEKKPG